MNNAKLRKWVFVTLTLLLFFVIESSLFPWLIPVEWRAKLLVYPKLVLVAIVYIAIFTNRRAGAAFGLAFGTLQDVMFYGHMIGVNAFTFGLSAYFAGLLNRPNAVSLFSVFLIQLSSLLLYETSLYGLYRLFVIEANFAWTFINGMLPSILISLFLALALYIPARKWLETPMSARESEEE